MFFTDTFYGSFELAILVKLPPAALAGVHKIRYHQLAGTGGWLNRFCQPPASSLRPPSL